KQNQLLAFLPFRPNRLNRFKNRTRFEQHPLATPKGPIIHRPVPIVGPISQVVNPNLNQPGLTRLLNNSVLERPPEKLGEDCQHVKLHKSYRSNNPSGKSTRISFRSTSITGQMARANGIKISFFPATFSSTGPPLSSIPSTMPIPRLDLRSSTLQPIRSA